MGPRLFGVDGGAVPAYRLATLPLPSPQPLAAACDCPPALQLLSPQATPPRYGTA